MAEQRFVGVDFLRAAACVLVVCHHLVLRLDHNRAPAAARGFVDWLTYGSYGVSIFFVLSGFLLARPFWSALDAGRPMPSLRVYAVRRAARILPGFWLALIVTFVLSITVFALKPDGQLLTRLVAGFLLVSDWHWLTLFPVEFNGPLWSIGFEITSYALLPLCFAALFRATSRLPKGPLARLWWLAIIGLVLALHWLVVSFAPIDDYRRGWDYGIVGGAKGWMPRYNPIGFFAIFALGALAAGVATLLRKGFRHWLLDVMAVLALGGLGLGLALSIGGGTEGYGVLGIPYLFPWFPLAAAAFLVLAPLTTQVGRLADNPVARFVARISFGIYLWHFLIIELIARLFPPAFAGDPGSAWTIWLISGAAAVAASVAVATISFYLLERPVVDWARTREQAGGVPTLSPSAG